jgi:hypothetical protein
MKSLYREIFRYTDDADRLDYSVMQLLRPIFDIYVKAGYSPREISHLIMGTITELELSAVLDKK